MNTRRGLFITATLLGTLAFTGCSSSVSRSDAGDGSATTETAAPDDATTTSVAGGETGTGGNGSGTTVASGGGAPTTTFPKITPVEKTVPPTTTDPNVGVIATISVQGLLPDVVTLTGKTLFVCAALPLSGKTTVTWTTSKATSVRLSIDSSRATSGLPANGSYAVPLMCGDTQNVTVTAIGSNGTVGRSKTISITVTP